MKSSIKIIAPATVANVGCGYDTIGFALDIASEEIFVEKRGDHQLRVKSIEGANLSLKAVQNVATIAAQGLLDYLGSKEGFDFSIKKLFAPGSGLGSSASSAAAAVFGVNQLLGEPLSTSDLLPFALLGEAYASKSTHADNVAPALLGGFIAIRSYEPLDYFSLPIASELKVLIIKPHVVVKTSEAKGLLPKTIDVVTARKQWGNLASLVHSFHLKDWSRLKVSIDDFIAEPVRKSLIPGYEQVKSIAFDHDSVGFNISGSGPSMFALFTTNESLEKAKEEIHVLYKQKSISCDFFTSKMSDVGCQIDR
ncbi:homoserine kinase [Ekhidna sp.]|uniref:homoserine kinase n=1 Tax=Ekhidna sp. TaxID=2608089 RepID=UPI003B513B28